MSAAPINRLSIVAVADVCRQVGIRSGDLFELCGKRARDSRPGPQQRWWARACHRHAWHIELATERMPTIPLVDPTMFDFVSDSGAVDDAEGATLVWLERVAALRAILADASTQSDPELDPNTARFVQLINADLQGLSAELYDRRRSHHP